MTLDTKLIHAGFEPDPITGAVNQAINVSSTYKQDGIGKFRSGNEYARTGNPSREALERTLAAIENGKYARAFASGLAANSAVLTLLNPGDEVVSTYDIYGGTYRLFAKVFPKYGIQFRFAEGLQTDDLIRAITPKTKIIWAETPTNPLLNILDIAKLAEAKPKGALLVVDNTFASPYLQNPLDLGADIVVHSTTKYIGGHSDVIGGAVVVNDQKLDEDIRFYQNAQGAVPSPFDCYLVQRGIKTLGLRMRRHGENALAVATALRGHAAIKRVYFPGFKDDRGYDVAQRQMRGNTGVVTVELKGGRAAVEGFVSKLKLFTFGESLGGVESLACFPFEMTHGGIPAEIKNRIGITEGLVRLSVGIEDSSELVAELLEALKNL